jgi:hypothetical protein
MLKRPVIGVSSLIAAFIVTEPVIYAFNDSQNLPNNLKCEAQIFSVASEQGITINGSLLYNPWLRECHFKYFDPTQNDVKTHSWHPILR